MTAWHRRPGPVIDGDFHLAITDRDPGWQHTSLHVATIIPGGFVEHPCIAEEVVVVPLSGSYAAELLPLTGDPADVVRIDLVGRVSVFDGPTDVLYVPPGFRVRLTQTGSSWGTVALCGAYVPDAVTGERDPFLLPAAEVPIELRGTGQATREVRNFAVPGVLAAERLIACEVITPAGNWSSWPPHKHDEDLPGRESRLEEIYWFDVRPDDSAPPTADPVGYFRMHDRARGEDPVRVLPGLDDETTHLDELIEVRPGEVVLVPHGWHGPAMAPPGYDLYYLNVMAGPGPERAWLITDDPDHAWVRQTWPDQSPDPRLPLGGQ
ncbi:MAG: 5-deoxy-glucuronate isomerase [Dermatophilaceae bacterium]